jgi:DNA-binding MarR family transcriptional regulator
MRELAAQAYSSCSGMTRRFDRLVDEGLVRRANTDTDGRGVVVGLTDAGLARLAEAASRWCAATGNNASPTCTASSACRALSMSR